MKIVGVRLPIEWASLGLPSPFTASGVVVSTGRRAWAWQGPAPDLGIADVSAAAGTPVTGWGLDHVVVLVPDLDQAVEQMARGGGEPRKRVIVRERPTAFFVVGPMLEVIQEPRVDRPLLWGLALETTEPLESVVARWRTAGHDVSDPRPAFQHGRSIATVRDAGAGLAVMSARGPLPAARFPDQVLADGWKGSDHPATPIRDQT